METYMIVLKNLERLFPQENLYSSKFEKYLAVQEVESLFDLAHLLISEVYCRESEKFGELYCLERIDDSIENFRKLEVQENKIFEILIKYSDFYYSNRGYSTKFEAKTFQEFVEEVV